MTVSCQVQLIRFVEEDGTVVQYCAQVRPPSFDASDLMTAAGWDSADPAAAEDWGLDNSVLYFTDDEAVRLHLFTAEQWADAAESVLTPVGEDES
jgi:hypothetical protein